MVTALLAVTLVGGVYLDGWAHVHAAGLETFFTPWHGVLYGAFTMLGLWVALMLWRRRLAVSWAERIPYGYGYGLVGVAVFTAGGLLDMAWHLAFGVEIGLEALISPTHLLLLTGGVLLVATPLRADTATGGRGTGWPAVLSLAAATSLAAFFLSYLSAFADPGARNPIVMVPHGLPGHREGELAAVAGVGGYLLTTLLLVVPLLHLYQRRQLPRGAATVLVAAAALPVTVLVDPQMTVMALAGVAAAVLVEVLLALWPALPDTVLAGLLPTLVWSGHLVGITTVAEVRWSPEMWAGAVALSALLAMALTRLPGGRPATHHLSAPAMVPPAVAHRPQL